MGWRKSFTRDECVRREMDRRHQKTLQLQLKKTLRTFTMDALISTKIKVVTDLADWFLCALHVYVDIPVWLCGHWKIDLLYQKNFCLSNSPWSTWMLWWSFRVFLIFFILSETLNKLSFILWRLRTMNWDDDETDITWF